MKTRSGKTTARSIDAQHWWHALAAVDSALERARGTAPEERLYLCCAALGDWLVTVPDHPVVYMVFNQTQWYGERLFLSWLDGTKALVPKLPSPLGPASAEHEGDPGVSVIVAGAHDSRPTLDASWRRVWQHYRTTTAILEKHGLTTWNQLLLMRSRKPKPFGVVWMPANDEPPLRHGGYMSVTDEDFLACDLPQLSGSLTADEFCRTACPRGTCRFAAITDAVASIQPSLPPVCLDARRSIRVLAKCLAYHLLRCYSIWGGTAFLSIPIPLHGGQPGGVSVLSLCTTTALGDTDVLNWTHVATRIFTRLSGEELVTPAADALTRLPPESVHQLSLLRVGQCRTVDGVLWPKGAHEPSDLFDHDLNLREFLRQQIVYPSGERIGVHGLVAAEFGLQHAGPDRVAQALQNDPGRFHDKRRRAVEFLRGSISGFVKMVEGIVGPLETSGDWARLPGQDDLWPESGRPNWQWNPDDYGPEARKFRLYASRSKMSHFLEVVIGRNLAKHVRSGDATNRILVHCAVDDAEPAVAWFVVANERTAKPWRGWPQGKGLGNTRHELHDAAASLGARSAFYGPVTAGGEFEVDPCVVIGDGSLAVRCERYVRSRFASGLRLFVVGIALPLFPGDTQ